MTVHLVDVRRTQRASLLSLTAEGDLSPEDADALLRALRWLDRIAYHACRAIAHLSASSPQRGARPSTPAAQ